MKKTITNTIKWQLRWLSLVAILLVGGMAKTQACSRFYYSATATSNKVNGVAGGKVYITNNANVTPTANQYQETMTVNGSGIGWDIVGSAGVTLHLYAQANENWIFDHWAQGSADGTQVGTPGVTSYNPTVRFNGSQNSRTQFNYYAVFVEMTGLIKVNSANPEYGSVTISNPDNKNGDEVTLGAIPDVANGVKFLGWTKDDGTEYVSTSNPYVLTANDETEGTYYAHFSEPVEKLYVRIQNKKTGNFLSFYGTTTASKHEISNSGRTEQDGFIFQNSLKMISPEEAQGNPETVFLRSGHAGGQGVTLNIDFSVNSPKDAPVSYSLLTGNQKTLNMVKEGDTYRISSVFDLHYNATQTAPQNCYLCDDGSGWLKMMFMDNSGVDEEAAEWYVYFLDEETADGAFGANTKAIYTKDGKYYTTMFADFAYQCLDGVKAYYLEAEESSYDETKQMLYFTEVPYGIVPANTAVVLECPDVQNAASKTPSRVLNRLMPLVNNSQIEPVINEGAHFLKGYVSVNGEKVTNNKQTMYVLSYNTVGLGFYRYSGANMNPNKAYLSLDGHSGAAAVSFTFGKNPSLGETNRISSLETVQDDANAPVYDLLGRKVSGKLTKGIYVRNGRKFVVK